MSDIGIYKFGGASIADIEGMQNVVKIITESKKDKILVVISAMGKTTNALEEVWKSRSNPADVERKLKTIIDLHLNIVSELCNNDASTLKSIQLLSDITNLDLSKNLHFVYDQLVSIGELLSTTIINSYLRECGVKSCWLDAREVIRTNDTYRDGKVDWEITNRNINSAVQSLMQHHDVIITQGFIGSDDKGSTITLGREGSDFSAAIFAHCLDASELSIWKDVKGILTADPRKFEKVVKIDRLTYKESIEMTYYGAKVIHPKTIKPLQNKQIPLYVKSFINPDLPGTMISSEIELTYPPIVVIEENQALIHFSTRDFSFIAEEHLAQLFSALDRNRLKVNLMKNTAISFTICVTNVEDRITNLIENLDGEYRITIDPNLELITVRHPNENIIGTLKQEKVVLMEERAPETVQVVVKDAPQMIRKR